MDCVGLLYMMAMARVCTYLLSPLLDYNYRAVARSELRLLRRPMELSVKVLRVLAAEGVRRVDLHCRVESGGEIQAESSSVSLGEAFETIWPTFCFQMRHPTSAASLLFTVFDLSGSTSSLSEIGHCSTTVAIQESGSSSQQVLTDDPNRTRLGLLGKQLAGVGVLRFTGKVWFQVQHRIKTPQNVSPNVQVSAHSAKAHTIVDLLKREAARSVPSSLPSALDRGVASVIFHTVTSRAESGHSSLYHPLTPIACIESSNSLSLDSSMEDVHHDQHLTHASIFKPVHLSCVASESLRLFIVDGQDKIHTNALSIASLRPFKVYHRHCTLHRDTTASRSADMTALISVLYTPPKSEYSLHEGLELLVSPPTHSSFSKLSKNVVLCAWLIDENSKAKAPVAGTPSSQPPFVSHRAKKGAQSDPVPVSCHVSVLCYSHPVSSHVSPAGDDQQVTPAYIFYPASPLLDALKAGFVIFLQVFFTAEPSSSGLSKPWWQTAWVASARLEVSGQVKQQLAREENRVGVFWELQGADIQQPSGLNVLESLSGILRWKTRNAPFLSAAVCSQPSSLPWLGNLWRGIEPRPQSSVSGKMDELPDLEAAADVRLADYERAMAGMAADILRLRQENAMLQGTCRGTSMQNAHRESGMHTGNSDLTALEALSKSNLIQRVLKLEKSLALEAKRREECEAEICSLTNALAEKGNTDAQLFQLQEVHATQQRLVRRLQSKLEKYRKCSDMCLKQEWLIAQLESLMADQAHGDRADSSALTLLRKENSELRALVRAYQSSEMDGTQSVVAEKEKVLRSLEAQLVKVTERCRELETAAGRPNANLHQLTLEHSSRVFELEQKLLLAETHSSALTTQLHESTRRWAVEKARYETKLAECSQGWNHTMPKAK